jgi:hypothetical protein
MSKSKIKPGELLRRNFIVLADELKAAMLFASTDDETRFVLNSLHIEVRVGKAPILVATDGRRLACIESVAEQGDMPAEVDFELTIGSHFLKPLCAFSKSQSAEISFEFHPSERIVANFAGGKCFVDCEEGAVIQQAYPNWRQVLPVGEKTQVPHIGVNAEYVGDFAKAAKLLGCESPIISVNLIGTGAAMEVRIEARPQFYGVLMPARVQEKGEWQPEFIGLLPEVKNESEAESEPESKEAA